MIATPLTHTIGQACAWLATGILLNTPVPNRGVTFVVQP